MGVRKDLRRAQRHGSGLAERARVELVKDEHGAVREARTSALGGMPRRGRSSRCGLCHVTNVS
ncbi:hypothetical protein SALBM135S_04654 [Streptomyces alboniger]